MGALVSQAIRNLVEEGRIASVNGFGETSIQPSSIDLTLGAKAWKVRGSTIPLSNGPSITELLKDERFVVEEIDLSKGHIFERDATYIAQCAESLDMHSGIFGIANPKSSAGRIDLQMRLLADYANQFDYVTDGYQGKLHLEICPKSMDIKMYQGNSANQLRLFDDNKILNDKKLRRLYDNQALLWDTNGSALKRLEDTIHANGLSMSINLSEAEDDGIVGYVLKADAPLLDYSAVGKHAVSQFWEPIHLDDVRDNTYELQKDRFYIFRTKEVIKVPKTMSVEMLPYTDKFGNFRSHYAGFFDPHFNAVGVLEIRPHDHNIIIRDGQPICKMEFRENNEIPDILYGQDVPSNYQGQGLKLGKHFYQD